MLKVLYYKERIERDVDESTKAKIDLVLAALEDAVVEYYDAPNHYNDCAINGRLFMRIFAKNLRQEPLLAHCTISNRELPAGLIIIIKSGKLDRCRINWGLYAIQKEWEDIGMVINRDDISKKFIIMESV